MIEGVILAAGLSSRAGRYKMALPLGDKTVIERCIESMYDICDRLIVVGGHRIEEISRLLAGKAKINIVFNVDYEQGMFTSVKTGLQHVKAERFFFTPGDYPLISKDVCEKMLGVEDEVVIPRYNGKRGHPVLLSKAIISELHSNSRYTNLKEFIDTRRYSFVDVSDPGILLDIDTMEDYKEVLNQIS